MASLDTRIMAVVLPAGFHRLACGRLCRTLPPAPAGAFSVTRVAPDGSPAPVAAHAGRRAIGVFGALRDHRRWLVGLVTADGTWFHGEYTDVRLLRQLPGEPAEPLRCVLTAELIVLD